MTEDRIARARALLEEGLKYPATMFYVRPGEFSEALRIVLAALGEREMTDDEYAAFVRAWEETERRPLDSGFEDCVRAGFAAAIRKATA